MRIYAIAVVLAMGPVVLSAPTRLDAGYAADSVAPGYRVVSVRAQSLWAQAKDAAARLRHPGVVAQSTWTGISKAVNDAGNVTPLFRQ